MTNLRNWVMFLLLAIIWGSSFLFIKVAGEDLQPFTLVASRLALGTAGLWIFAVVKQIFPPLDRSSLIRFFGLGLVNTFLPFVLITWGETHISSGAASVLNGTVPLFSLVIAHFMLHDERITWWRAVGLLIGFAGILLIFSNDLFSIVTSGTSKNNLLGELAIVGAAICYAIATVYARYQFRSLPSSVLALMQVSTAFIFSLIAALMFESPTQLLHIRFPALGAIFWLGLLGTCIAYLMFFAIISEWGATRATLVTYLVPLLGVSLGAWFLHENIEWQLIIGFVLIVSGIVLVNRHTASHKPLQGVDNTI